MADETMTDEQILKDVEHKSFAATSDRTAASLSASGVAAEDVARAAAQAAYDKKGEDVQVLDLTELSDVCDYLPCYRHTTARLIRSSTRLRRRSPRLAASIRSPSRAASRRLGCSWTTVRLSSTSSLPKPATSTASRNSGETPPSSPSISSSSSFETGFSYPHAYRRAVAVFRSCPPFFLPKVANLGRGFFSYYLPFADRSELRFIA